jgi:hypothetical protein
MSTTVAASVSRIKKKSPASNGRGSCLRIKPRAPCLRTNMVVKEKGLASIEPDRPDQIGDGRPIRLFSRRTRRK